MCRGKVHVKAYPRKGLKSAPASTGIGFNLAFMKFHPELIHFTRASRVVLKPFYTQRLDLSIVNIINCSDYKNK